jgi:electron transfer flavoprotein beta subunit
VRIAVCIKQIPNPDALAAVLRVDQDARVAVLPPGHPMVVSPFDEQAIEAALRIRDQCGAQVKITAISLGPESARAALRQALSLGADDAVHLLDAAFVAADAYVIAHALAAAIRKLGDVDLILTGRQAADWDSGIVGLGIAEILDIPSVSFACELELKAGALRVKRVLQDGFETVASPLPALVTISNELGEVRKPNLRETMRAARKPVAVWSAADLTLDARRLTPRRTLERLFIPEKTVRCELIDGATGVEQGVRLARRLIESRLV